MTPNKKSKKPTVLSLFSGVGGLDYGFEAGGFQTGAAVEFDADCCASLRSNRRWPVFERSIFDVPTEEMLDAIGAKRGEVDVVVGGPPCQPFSKSGYWASGDSRRLADPRAGTLGAYMRVVQDVLPKVLLLENVEGLAYSGKNEGLRFVLDMIDNINRATGAEYKPTWRVLCAADYGVPQMRHRLFLVASRDGRDFNFPLRTHDPPDENSLFQSMEPYRTAWDALGDVVNDPSEDLEMRGKWGDLLPSIPEGENYLWHTERGGGLPMFGWRRRFWSFLLKLAKDRPSWTLQAQPGPGTGPFHWDNRRLSMRELCRLQTFPDNVAVSGSYRAVHRQMGNAVPSLLAEVLAREIRHQLLDLPALKSGLQLLPPVRAPVPPPRRIAKVPKKYLPLVGDHDPHPGTGLGYRASVRVKATKSGPRRKAVDSL